MRFFLALLLSLMMAYPAKAAEPIVIGDFNSYAEVANYAVPTRNGWQMALDEINEAGGILGRPVKVVSRDDRGTPEDATQVVEDLLSTEKTKLIMGGFQSHIGAAVSNLAKKDGFLFAAPWSGAERLLWQDGHDLVFRIQPPPQTYGAILAKYAAGSGAKRWVTVSPDYEGGHGFTKAFTDPFFKNNPEARLVKQYWPPLDKIDAGSTVQAARRDNADGIFTHLYGSDLTAFIREGNKRALFKGKEVVTVVAGWQENYSGLGKDYPIGWLSTGYPAAAIKTPAHRAFYDAYKKRYGKEPTFGSLYGYITLKTLAAGIEKAQSTEPHKVSRAIRGMTMETPIGPMTIRKVDGQSTLGLWVGRTAWADGKPSMTDIVYEDGASHLPDEKTVRQWQKGK